MQEEFEEDIAYKFSVCNLATSSVLTVKLLQKSKAKQTPNLLLEGLEHHYVAVLHLMNKLS